MLFFLSAGKITQTIANCGQNYRELRGQQSEALHFALRQGEDTEAQSRRLQRHNTLMARCAEIQKVVRRSTEDLQKAEQSLLSGTGETAQRAAPAFFRVKADDRKSPPSSARGASPTRGTSPTRCARPSSPTRSSSTKRNSRD